MHNGEVSKAVLWRIEPHTAAKHKLLQLYLGAWFPIMASQGLDRRLLYLDAFAGPGVYRNGEPGSPLIALQALLSHPHFHRWNDAEFAFLFIERDRERFESLVAEIDRFFTGRGRPANVKVHTVHGEFIDTAAQVLASVSNAKKALAPTFAMVDPFGWKGVPIDLIGRLLSFDKCEVFFTFVLDSVNRWVGSDGPGIGRHFLELFGTDEHLRAANLSGEQRRQFLRDLYAQQLQKKAGFRYVRSFGMVDERNRLLLYLFYGTRSLAGLEAMKNAMWKVDPTGGVRFSDRLAGQTVLFGTTDAHLELLRVKLLTRFAGKDVSVEEVREFVLAETPYSANHFKKGALKVLEGKGDIEVVTPRKRRCTYPYGTVVRFRRLG